MTKITKLMCLYQLNETDTDLFVSEDPKPRECSRCKQKYIPTNNDISTRRPSVYYKQCSPCRAYFRERSKIYLEKIKNDIKTI